MLRNLAQTYRGANLHLLYLNTLQKVYQIVPLFLGTQFSSETESLAHPDHISDQIESLVILSGPIVLAHSHHIKI